MYIAEAHASDEWPIGKKEWAAGPQHTRIEDRRAAVAAQDARLGSVPWRCYCDAMEDGFLRTYGAWPVRFFLFRTTENAARPGEKVTTVKWSSTPEGCVHNLHPLVETLEQIHDKRAFH